MRGRFITFEGGEGAGKSTQIKKLADRLNAAKLRTLVTREPGGSPGAEIMRHLVLSGMGKLLGPEAETLLFAAARDDHIQSTIRPALAQGKWVISDRFIDSTRVYQGTLGEVDAKLIRGLERLMVGEAMPDLTVILDLPAGVGLKRAAGRRGKGKADRFEDEQLEFHNKLREAYRRIAESEPQRCVLIDADRAKKKIADEIWSIVNARLDPAAAPMSFEDAHP